MSAPTTHGTSLAWDRVGVRIGGRTILDDISLCVPTGAWLSLIGPNGAGKTTLLRTITGAVSHTGAIHLHGADARGLPPRHRARQVAVVPQLPTIPPGIAVFDYALLGRAPHQGLRYAASRDDRDRTAEALARLDLTDLAARTVDTLSGGERQRVVLARALVQDTGLLVLDEPTAALDVGHQLDVLELVAELHDERGLTVVTTVHDLGVAGQFADRVAVLAGGRLVADGPPAHVLTPETIAAHWGVDAETTIDDDGSVRVVIRRRARRTRGARP